MIIMTKMYPYSEQSSTILVWQKYSADVKKSVLQEHKAETNGVIYVKFSFYQIVFNFSVHSGHLSSLICSRFCLLCIYLLILVVVLSPKIAHWLDSNGDFVHFVQP